MAHPGQYRLHPVSRPARPSTCSTVLRHSPVSSSSSSSSSSSREKATVAEGPGGGGEQEEGGRGVAGGEGKEGGEALPGLLHLLTLEVEKEEAVGGAQLLTP